MAAVAHLPGCASVRHEPERRARCSCGADPDDRTPPECCPGCGRDMDPLTSWSTPVIADGRAMTLITCSNEACRSRAEELAGAAADPPRADGFSQARIDELKAAMLAPAPRVKR